MNDLQLNSELSKLTPEELKKFEGLTDLLNDKFKALKAFKRLKVQESNNSNYFSTYF